MSTYNNLYSIHPRILRNRIYVKEYLKRPVVLTIGILYLLSAVVALVVSIINSAVSAAGLIDFYNSFGAASGIPTDFNVSISLPTIDVIGIITGIAFIVLFAKSRSVRPDTAPTGGATTLWVLAIIQLVFSILGATVLVFFGVAFFLIFLVLGSAGGAMLSQGSAYNFASLTSAVATSDMAGDTTFTVLLIAGITILVTYLVMAGYLLFVSISYLRFTSSIRKSLNSPELHRGGAAAFGFISVLSSIASIFTLICIAVLIPVFLFFDFSALFNMPIETKGLVPTLVISLVPQFLAVVLNICIAKFAYGYNKHIKAAGVNGENLPMPIIESPDRPRDFATAAPTAVPYANAPSADIAKPVAVEEENPFAPPAPIYTEPHAEQTVDIPATETADTEPQCDIIEEPYIEPEAPAANSVSIQDVNPEAKEIVNEVLASVSNNTSEKRICNSCGASINATSKFCPRCGASQF